MEFRFFQKFSDNRTFTNHPPPPVRECPKFRNHPHPIFRTSFVDGPIPYRRTPRLACRLKAECVARAKVSCIQTINVIKSVNFAGTLSGKHFSPTSRGVIRNQRSQFKNSSIEYKVNHWDPFKKFMESTSCLDPPILHRDGITGSTKC